MTGSAIEYKVPSIPTLSGIFCKGNLEDLTNRLSAVTEFSFTIVDSNEQEIIKTKNNNRYCKECCAKNCGQCQMHNELYKLKETESCDPILISCFKGLCGVAIPIWMDGHYLGAFVGGRIRIQGRKPINICCGKPELLLHQEEKNYCRVPAFTQKKLKAVGELMSFMIREMIQKESDTLRLSCQEKEEKVLADLISEIENHKYKEACDAAKLLADHIFKTYSPENRRERFMEAASNLIYLIPGLDENQRRYYLKKYTLSGMTLFKPTLCYCWLVQIITDIFRQQCSVKYLFMNKVIKYIDDNRNDDIIIQELAEYAGISSGYMSRIIKRHYNISIVDYIHLRKLQLAIYYMSTSEMNISDVSYLLGYSEAGYFCKIFKKHEGMTPSTFCDRYIRKRTEAAV